MMRIVFLGFGVVFGFLMSRAGATDFENYSGLFLLRDFTLLWVIVAAVATGILGMTLLRVFGSRAVLGAEALSFKAKPMTSGLVPGSLLFGFGWGLSGTCPGAAPAMLGEGRMIVLPTIVGILAGTYLFGVYRNWRAERGVAQTSIAE
jgi:uncharacterized membrane protein YedE/YeeE